MIDMSIKRRIAVAAASVTVNYLMKRYILKKIKRRALVPDYKLYRY
jgi:hypothetical protein